jgi:hypothetical protein
VIGRMSRKLSSVAVEASGGLGIRLLYCMGFALISGRFDRLVGFERTEMFSRIL